MISRRHCVKAYGSPLLNKRAHRHIKGEYQGTVKVRKPFTLTKLFGLCPKKIISQLYAKTAFFLLGELVEYGNTDDIFTSPKDERTERYITGRFG